MKLAIGLFKKVIELHLGQIRKYIFVFSVFLLYSQNSFAQCLGPKESSGLVFIQSQTSYCQSGSVTTNTSPNAPIPVQTTFSGGLLNVGCFSPSNCTTTYVISSNVDTLYCNSMSTSQTATITFSQPVMNVDIGVNTGPGQPITASGGGDTFEATSGDNAVGFIPFFFTKPLTSITITAGINNIGTYRFYLSDVVFNVVVPSSPTLGTIIANPTSGSSGTTINVTGSGWAVTPGSSYQLLFDGRLVAQQPIAACSDQPNLSFDVPCGASIGNHTITCNQGTLSKSISFSVTTPAISPLTTPCPIQQAKFDSFIRYPAEEQTFIQMVGDPPTAYYRDFFVGSQTKVTNAQNGSIFSTVYTFPDFATLTRSAVFYSQYNGQQNCFVFSDGRPPKCGSTSATLQWPFQSQCGRTGFITADFYSQDSGASIPIKFFTGEFLFDKRTPPDTVPWFYQLDPAWGTDTYGTPGAISPKGGTPTIQGDGCAMCACAQLLNYHVFHGTMRDKLNPKTLNAYLRARKGGYAGLGIIWENIADYAKEIFNVNVRYLPNQKFTPTDLCSKGPELIELTSSSRDRTHWVTAIGDPNNTSQDFLVCDPGTIRGNQNYLSTTYTYPDRKIPTSRVFVGPEVQVNAAGIIVMLHSPAELLLADPQGHRTGLNPTTGQAFTEIPNSHYGTNDTDTHIDDDPGGIPDTDVKELEVGTPTAGTYKLTLTGTGTGTYNLLIDTRDTNGDGTGVEFDNVPIAPGIIHNYEINYSPTLGSKSEIVGGFDGGGQRPRDVNKFLSYANITSDQTSLPSGNTTFQLFIIYNKSVVTTSFTANLNGQNIAFLFHPTPGNNEVITLPLQKGRNVLELSIDGNLPNKVANDKDRLVFNVQ